MNPLAPVSRVRNSSAAERGDERLMRRAKRVRDGRGLIPTVGHAVVAARIASPPVEIPVGLLEQLLVARGVAVRHQVTGALPAEDRITGDAPGRAVEVDP